MNVGMMALIIATALILLRTVDEAQGDPADAVGRHPDGDRRDRARRDDAGDPGAGADHERHRATSRRRQTIEPIVAFGTGLVSVYSSTSGVVLPAFLPMVPELAQRLGGIDPLRIAWSMNVSASLVDLSSLSTVGALFIAGAAPGTDVRKLFNGLLVWGLSMSVVGACSAGFCLASIHWRV